MKQWLISIFIFVFLTFIKNESYSLSFDENDSLKNEIYINGETFPQGMLSLSSDKKYLVLYGYSKYGALGGNSSSIENPRTLALVNQTGDYNFVQLTNVHGNAAARGVALQSLGNNNYTAYLAGSGTSANNALQGVDITTNTFTQVGVNSRVHAVNCNFPKIFEDKLYLGLAPSDSRILKIGSFNQTSGFLDKSITDVIQTGILSEPLDFTIIDNTLYVADKNVGLRKFFLNNGSWTNAGFLTLENGEYFISITGRIESGIRTLYAITNKTLNNSIYKIEDASVISDTIGNNHVNVTQTLLMTAGADKGFRGISFVPEPLSTLPLSGSIFQGLIKDNGIKLSWRTFDNASEGRYGLYQSNDGLDFNQLLSFGPKEFISSYEDKNPTPGGNYYKLSRIDGNGVETRSRMVFINYTSLKNSLPSAYINSSSELVVNFAQPDNVSSFRVVSTNGSVIFKKEYISKAETSFNIPIKHKGLLSINFLFTNKTSHTIKIINN